MNWIVIQYWAVHIFHRRLVHKVTGWEMDGTMDGLMDRQTNRWIDGLTIGWTDRPSFNDRDLKVGFKEMDASRLKKNVRAEFVKSGICHIELSTSAQLYYLKFSTQPCKPEVARPKCGFLMIFFSFRIFDKDYHWNLCSLYTRYAL